MVTASKVQDRASSKDGRQIPSNAGSLSYAEDEAGSPRSQYTSEFHQEMSQADSENLGPLSFGEQLVLETYLRFRGRRYDRQRQDALSQPRKIKPPPDASSGRHRKLLDKDKLGDLLERLAKPKRGKVPDSGEMIALHASRQEMVKQKAIQARDVEATFARLSAPKSARGYDPTPGEKVCLMYNQHPGRSVNLDRLADMAKPKKRGGAAEAWALTAISSKEPGNVSLPSIGPPANKAASAPASARGPGPKRGDPQGRAPEKLPEVARPHCGESAEPAAEEQPRAPLSLPPLGTQTSSVEEQQPADPMPAAQEPEPKAETKDEPKAEAFQEPQPESPSNAPAQPAEDGPESPKVGLQPSRASEEEKLFVESLSALGLTESTMQALALRPMDSDGYIDEECSAEVGSSWPEPPRRSPEPANGEPAGRSPEPADQEPTHTSPEPAKPAKPEEPARSTPEPTNQEPVRRSPEPPKEPVRRSPEPSNQEPSSRSPEPSNQEPAEPLSNLNESAPP